jgi:hypothetical protein
MKGGLSMEDHELIDTLNKAAASQENVALKYLLIIAAERIQKLHFMLTDG